MNQSRASTWSEAIYRNELLRTSRTLAEIWLRLASGRDLLAHARLDLGRLAGALDGVLALHAPDAGAGIPTCPTCPPGPTRAARRRQRGWPCPTIRAVCAALDLPEVPEPHSLPGLPSLSELTDLMAVAEDAPPRTRPPGRHRADRHTPDRAGESVTARPVQGAAR